MVKTGQVHISVLPISSGRVAVVVVVSKSTWEPSGLKYQGGFIL